MISYWNIFRNLSSLLCNLTYLSLLNSFLCLSRFSISLKSLHNYFFRWFAYKSLLSRLSVLISYNMWSSNHFSISSCFPCFSGSWFFRVWVQGPGPGPGSGSRVRVQVQGPGSGSRVRVQVLELAVRDNNFFDCTRSFLCLFCCFLCLLFSPSQVTYILCDNIMSERHKIWKSPTN